MASELDIAGSRKQTIPAGNDTRLLLEAFEMFTQASGSLESAFARLHARAQRLTEELEAKNIELAKSLFEKEQAITEMKALQEQSKRMERLSAMGEMAVELAHEIRNPLGSIELFASLLENELTGDEKRWAENIRIGIQSLNNIVSNMLQLARPVSPNLFPLDVHDVIREVLNFTGPIMAQRQVSVVTQLEAACPVISADRDLLKQVLLNLVLNAMNAMPSKGSLIVGTRNIQTERFEGSAGALELKIQDTGIGIPRENLDRIFDPFFTTNKNGTGLGLSVVHQIVERHGGSISVSSEINLGTTFTIAFGCATGKSGDRHRNSRIHGVFRE